MKKVILLFVFAFVGTMVYAQKPALDHGVYDAWQSVSAPKILPDGSAIGYTIDPEEGDGELVIRRITDGKVLSGKKYVTATVAGSELVVPRGGRVEMSPDGSRAYCLIKPEFAQTREAKIAKKKEDEQPKDTLAYINLKTLEITKVGPAKSFKTGHDAMPFVAYSFDEGKKGVKGVAVLNPATGATDTLKHADKFAFNRSGKILAVVTKKDKGDSLSVDALLLYNTTTGACDTLDSGKSFYSLPTFDIKGQKIVFLASTDTTADGNKRCALNVYDGSLSEVVPQTYSFRPGDKQADQSLVSTFNGYRTELLEWTLNENSEPYFSASGERIFVGIAPLIPAKDSTKYDFETAKVDIWNWDALATPPMQKKQRERIVKKTYPAVVEGDKIIPLSTGFYEDVRLFAGGDGDWALAVDSGPYTLSSMWDIARYCDVYKVSMADGSRERIFEKLPDQPRLSPEGKYLCWFNVFEGHFYTYNTTTGETVNVTENVPTIFYDETNDTPSPARSTDMAEWLEGDEFFLVSDRYDLWLLAANGSKAENLTKGIGKTDSLRFRKMSPIDWNISPEERKVGLNHSYSLGDERLLSVSSYRDKKNGYAVLSGARPQEVRYFTDTTMTNGNPVQARDAAVVALIKGNFRQPADLWLLKGKKNTLASTVTKEGMDAAQRLTTINPQQNNYRWGKAELVHWTAYDGTRLDGLLYLPDDPKGKIPMIVYYYEKNSENLYKNYNPAPSRSIVNIPFCVSNGYAVFVPDIVYVDGHPGESAYNCIVSGTEAMCEQYDIIDKSRMAIQGQSWGGYQTAYLITRTDLYAAAGSGAPVGNMTSAYGGIRWESGITRAGQYEHGQSRIGKTLWDEGGLDLYIENSPVFHADKVTTPVLIMHNDEDGAVPWYQGIEFFSDLRRLGKPAWLLQYNGEAHNLVQRKNCKDLSIRMMQFFDHYLKGAPAPAWMTYGVPEWQKGQYFGYELTE